MVVLLVVVLVGGTVPIAVGRIRNAAAAMQCRNNAKQLGIALPMFLDQFGHYPAGTASGTTLPPDRRLSWLVEIFPTYINAQPRLQFDKAKAWDDEGNCPPWYYFTEDKFDREAPRHKELVGDVKLFLCPANPARNSPLLPCPMWGVGIAGVGTDAAELPTSDRRAGLFGYDRKVKPADIADGASTTMAVAEVVDGGPWTAGGRATVRGLEADGVPYLGEGGQFTAFHQGGPPFSWSRSILTNVLFADGSVRGLTATVPPELLEALATIAGGEEVGIIPE